MGIQATAHDISMAHFKVYTENDACLYIDIRFSQEDFKLAITENGKRSYTTHVERNDLIKTYLNTHFAITFNGQQQQLSVIQIQEEGHHFYIQLGVQGQPKQIDEVQLENTCLLAVEEKQINMIELHLNDKVRGFNMNKNRTAIIANY